MSTHEDSFEIAVDGTAHARVITVRGELDALTAPRLTRVMYSVLEERASTVVIDLANVTFIDSTGMSALVRGNLTSKALGAKLSIRGATGNARRALDICGLTGLLE